MKYPYPHHIKKSEIFLERIIFYSSAFLKAFSCMKFSHEELPDIQEQKKCFIWIEPLPWRVSMWHNV